MVQKLTAAILNLMKYGKYYRVCVFVPNTQNAQNSGLRIMNTCINGIKNFDENFYEKNLGLIVQTVILQIARPVHIFLLFPSPPLG